VNTGILQVQNSSGLAAPRGGGLANGASVQVLGKD